MLHWRPPAHTHNTHMHAEWRTARGIQQRLSHCKFSCVRWPDAGCSRKSSSIALLLLIAAAASGVASRRGGSGPLLPSHPHRSRRALQESAPAAAPAPAAADTGQDGRQEVVLAVFGDSLSDTGNTFRAAGVPQADLYCQGRYSNGPIWVDYLATAVANTTQLTVWNYAYGGAVACPDTTAGGGGGLSGRYPFIRDLPAQTELFLNQTAAEQRRWQQGQQAEAGDKGGGGGGGARRRMLVPINWIGNDDVRLFMRAAIIAGSPPDSRALTSLALAITSCRLAWAQQLLAAGEAVWGQQRGPERVLVLLPLMQLDLLPETPEPLRPQLRQIVAVLNAVLNGSVAALQQDLDAAAGAGAGGGAGGGGGGARLLVLPEEMESLIQSVRPPFNSSGPCFNHPLDGLQPVAVADVRPCADPNNHAFYDQLNPSTRVHEALALRQVLPALRRAGLPL